MGRRDRGGDPAQSRGDGEALTIGGIVAVLASLAASALAYGTVPGELELQLTAGTGAYYGPEAVPATLVLAGVPVLVSVVALGGHCLSDQLCAVGERDRLRQLHTASVLATLAVLVGVQSVLVVPNL